MRAGEKVGTMWGIMTPEDAAEVLPEPATKPQKKDPEDPDLEKMGERNPWARTSFAAKTATAAGDAVLRTQVEGAAQF